MQILLDILISVLLLAGAAFVLIGSYGLAKLGDFFKRLHAPTKATTLGLGGVLLASILHFSLRTHAVSIHELLVTGFLFLTAPISAHLLMKAALTASRQAPPQPPPADPTKP